MLNLAHVIKLLVEGVVEARRLDILLDGICEVRQLFLHQLYF
jgi:hypothetical protein